MQKSISLKGKGEWAGARKLLSALKRSRRIKGKVELKAVPRRKKNPTTSQLRRARKPGYRSAAFHPTAAQWEQMRKALGIGPGSRPRRAKNASVRRKKTWDYSGRRKRNAAGFMRDGVFHPIRSGERAVYRIKKGKRKLLGYFPDDMKYSRKRAGETRKRK